MRLAGRSRITAPAQRRAHICATDWNLGASHAIISTALNLEPLAMTYLPEAIFQEAVMTHWHDTMVDRPETDGAVYATGWTISGLAVIGTIVAVWLLGI